MSSNDTEFLSVTTTPAQPGFFVIYDDKEGKEVMRGEPVLAWQIETIRITKGFREGEIDSRVTPLVLDGAPASNWIGVQNPDETVTVVADTDYDSLEELQKYRYPENGLNQSGLETLETLGARV